MRFDDIDGAASPARRSSGISAPRPPREATVSFAWSGDTAGQGWGIDENRGGMRTYRTMLDNRPDFFIHSGDHIYADCPVERELKLPDGEIWRNIVTEEKSVVAHTLEQFRGNYKYNWLDDNFRAFHAAVPAVRAMGRSRGHQRLGADRHRRRNRLCRGRLFAAGGAGAPRVP